MLGRGSKAVNAGPRPDAGPKPKSGAEAQKWGRSPMQGQNPKVNAELEPDVRPKPNAVNARLEPYTGSEPDVGSEPNAVGRPSVHSSSCRGGRVKAASGLPAKVGTTCLSCGVGGRDGLGLWSQHISLWRSEDRGWSTCEGWHDSPVVRGGWPRWTASGHSTSRHGEVKTAGGLPAKWSRQAVRTPECGLSSGPACARPETRGLGVSTFPWGRVMDTLEKESPLIILRPEGRGRICYPGLGVWNT
ncbi:hypothetical protein CRG98_012024 [Punica granatum]|uniref:Uncharacterized protein n=1 Tax=Punica granatum TaxID=22663 RepID=A0A2I0KGI4_PUNGR|nr:hypothetical protein CRG98_012024 [Punica granatum]